MKRLLLLVVVSVVASGCMRTAAKTAPDAPLDMPAPPPREMEPNDTETPAPVPLVIEPARSTPPRPRPVTPREQPARSEPPKPEPPKIEPPVEAPKPVEEPIKSPSTLQTTPATAEGEVERAIRASLQRANADLNRIDYRVLNADAKTQYDTAKRFIRQADEAMKAKNLVFAKTVADKAVVIAAQLGGR